MSRTRLRSISGFTLIELLVVIAIIAILAAILFPVFARAREKARQTSCLNNVKQITLGLLMYCNDYDGKYPERYYVMAGLSGCSGKCFWPRVVEPYIQTSTEGLWRCPSYREARTNWYCGAYADYGFNYRLDNLIDGQVRWPAMTVLMGETAYWHTSALRWYGWYTWYGFNSYNYNAHTSGSRYDHNGLQNLGFCDGHAKAGTETAFKTAYAAGHIRITR